MTALAIILGTCTATILLLAFLERHIKAQGETQVWWD